jgi:methyltransferase (TIGR00027 family)
VKHDRPSVTAAWVAACRGLYELLPERERLARDPYGTRFSLVRFLPRPVARALFPRRAILYMQVRTRVIDDVMLAFIRDGGTQIVILGAGFDCRALRFERELEGATVYEIDHPTTQRKKRAIVGDAAHAKYIAWDFEARDTRELGAAIGHDPSRKTLTIWEGVTMYLSPRAIDETLHAIHGYSAPGSKLVFTYMARSLLERPSVRARLGAHIVQAIGERFTFGWDPRELGAYLEARGFTLERNATMHELAGELLDDRDALATAGERLIAVAQVTR